ncbi:MAG: rane protein [Neobacillus sp.]|nr:rane protein [Neobacillus sp.]
MPLWIVLAIYGLFTVGPPSVGQSIQSGIVAISSGVIATVLFFQATDMVRGNMQKLGHVEATQSISVLFAVIGELILLKAAFPSTISWTGMLLVMSGMVLHSYVSHKEEIPDGKKVRA